MPAAPGGFRASATQLLDDAHHSRSDVAYAQIRKMLLDGELPQGSSVTEAELTRALNVSRTPIREALTRLSSEGFLRSGPGRGYIVVELTAKDLSDVFAVRIELEGLAAQEAADQVGRVDLARLDDLYDEMALAKDAGDNDELALVNNRFHSLIAEISGNAFLKATLDDIRSIFDVYSPTALTLPGRRDEAHVEHGQMIEALRAKDGRLARELARVHFEHGLATRQALLAAKLRGEEPSSGS